MRKFLLITALLAMGTMAMGVAPATGDKAKADVEVRAEIVEDSLVITDIYGQPLVLDFGKIQKGSLNGGAAELEYKVSATEGPATPLNLDLKLAGKTATTDVILNPVDQSLQSTITSKLSLDKYAGVMEANKTEYRGRIFGSIAKDQVANAGLGFYRAYTEIEVTVK